MSKTLYPRLALTNVKKNAKLYLPYIISSVFTVGMFYIMASLMFNEDLENVTGAGSLSQILPLGCVIIGIFACIFILYTNSFLMKRRNTEIGLYCVLGMEKRHIALIILFETLYAFVLSAVFGIAFGILFDKLSVLLLTKILRFGVLLGFHVSFKGICLTAGCFALIFFLSFVKNIIRIYKSDVIELLRGGKTGEKEPKTKLISAILGFAALIAGYTIALTVKNPLSAFSLYFVAVICVIAGTYLLFMSGSIAVLKMLKKNKSYYYNKRHFNAVSGMLYRMKQNAVGLANICILSTMVLVMVSATVALYAGVETAVKDSYPLDMSIRMEYSDFYSADGAGEFDRQMKEVIGENSINAKNYISYDCYEAWVKQKDGELIASYYPDEVSSDVHYLVLITSEGYKSITGENAVLGKNEALCCSLRAKLADTFTLCGDEYKIVRRIDKPETLTDYSYTSFNVDYIVLSDESVLEHIYTAINEEMKNTVEYFVKHYIFFDIDGTDEDKQAAYTACNAAVSNFGKDRESSYSYSVALRDNEKEGFYEIFGSLLFLGIVLGLLFMIVTVMIIYYKQVSEGYADRERFIIMQNVGMSRDEVKSAIHSQVLTVFFLPLVTAFMHLAFSYPITSRVLALFQMSNTGVFALCLVITAAVFALIYMAVYMITARTYYKIVSK